MKNAEDAVSWLQKTSNNSNILFAKNKLIILKQGGIRNEATNSFPITLTEASFPEKWPSLSAKLRASIPDVLEIRLTAPEWKELPIPLDLIITSILAEIAAKPPQELHILLPDGDWWHSLVTLWNLRAAVGLFAGEITNRRLAREQFLREVCGEDTSALLEFFRIGERSFLTATALAGLSGRSLQPLPSKVFSQQKLEHLADILDQAPAENALVRAEIARLGQTMERLRQESYASIRRISPGQESQFLSGLHGGQPSVRSSVAISVDVERLFVHLEAVEPEMSGRKLRCTKRDEPVWEDDCFEIFLLADGTDTPEEGWQFIVNGKGAIWDGRRFRTHDDATWSAPGARAEVTESPAGWTMHFSVPWNDLGFDKPPVEGHWRANIYRTRRVGNDIQAFAWSPIENVQYYSPEEFGWIDWK